MSVNWRYLLHSGKNSKFKYYTVNVLRDMMPRILFTFRLKRKLAAARRRKDYDEISGRVDYYCKLTGFTPIADDATRIADVKRPKHQTVYYFDSACYLRWFNKSLQCMLLPGDITFVPEYPSIVKSRPIAGDNANSVLLNLDKVRHFVFLKDRKPFREKLPMAIFRGSIGVPHRLRFMQMYFGHPMVDAGDVCRHPVCEEWIVPKKTLYDHLDYRFIISLEGNDVASNLKWIMSSNSLAVMPRPTFETWFMEGSLVPNYHYVEIKPDFSDLVEKLNYYNEHIEEAEAIISHAHEHVDRFRNPARERDISLLVLDKYFRMTNN